MIFNVPQFIGMEDKIVFHLTAKQLGWFGLGGLILLVFWRSLDSSAFIILAVIVFSLSGAFAFYQPFGQTLLAFLISSFTFVLRPKMYTWGRHFDLSNRPKELPKKIDNQHETKKVLDISKMEELSRILDNKK